jgi:toxin ParE1/3/4
MDYHVSWSPEALDDVDAIAEYIARDSAFYAEAVVTRIKEVSRSLNQLPNRGRVVPEIGLPPIREIPIYSYRLIYRIQQQNVLIISVIHGRKILQPSEYRIQEL